MIKKHSNEKFIKANWFKLSLLLIIIVIISGGFYWYEIRPVKIMKKCIRESASTSFTAIKQGRTNTKEEVEEIYTRCLKKHGINE